MKINKNLQKIIDNNIFSMPPKRFVSKLIARKFPLDKHIIETKPSLFVSFLTTRYDKYLLSSSFDKDFVLLNDDITYKLQSNSLSNEEQKNLVKAVNDLIKQNVCVVILYGKFPSIFGNNQEFSTSMTSFLYETKLDIKFLTFNGSYFASPVWAPYFRKCKTNIQQQLVVKHRMLIGSTKREIHEYINAMIPSSATIYSLKNPVQIKSNKLALDLETIMYCCPACSSFFTMYSEFSCLKCKNCTSAFEISDDGLINFSKKIKSMDDIEVFLFKNLTKKDFDINAIISYNNIIIKENIENNKNIKISKLEIFAEYLIISDNEKSNTINYIDIKDAGLTYNNTLVLILDNDKSVIIQGKNKENLYIILDLIKLNKN